MKSFFVVTGLDFLLLLTAFGMVHWLNYGNLQMSFIQFRLFILLLVSTFLASLAVGKYKRFFRLPLQKGMVLILKSAVIIGLLAPFWIIALQRLQFSRTMTYGTILFFAGQEAAVLLLYWRRNGAPATEDRIPETETHKKCSLHYPLFLFDGVFLAAAFVGVAFCVRGDEPILAPPYSDILPILLGVWLGVSLATGKFNKIHFNDYFSALGVGIKSFLVTAAGLTFLVYFLRLEETSRIQLFGPLVALLAMEGVVFWFYSNYRQYRQTGEDIEDVAAVRDIISREEEKPSLEGVHRFHEEVNEPAGEKLEHALEFFDSRILKMLKDNADVNTIERSACQLLSTDELFNLEIMDDSSMDLIMNLHKINDIRRLNVYFLSAHQKLTPGGYLMGKAYTITNQYEYYQEKYPKGLGTLCYTGSFIWGRVFPKLPVLKKIYFAVTKGRNRMISRAEILGRLSFCGYKIIADDERGQEFFFLARKTRHPSPHENPTYGPLVKLRRNGQEGRPIEVYKFRTMYPFSEFLQEYVYENCNLDEGGKFKDDFRVTGWGAFMRRHWLDELPMFYNWFRGEMQLVGVRPLSRQYMQLYNEDVRNLRQKVKPGLLPPFYADMPSTLEEIMESERRYIEDYLKKPTRTQTRYFCRCVWNIAVCKRRSQ